MDETLSKIKTILSLTDDSQDKTLSVIVDLISQRVKARIKQDEIPDGLAYVVVEATISRFNRINDEGKQSASESDISATFVTDDLLPFADDLNNWCVSNGLAAQAGKFVFY